MRPEGEAPPPVQVGDCRIGLPGTPLLVAGPCVLEGAEEALLIARTMAGLARDHGFGYVFKASFDKANRTSLDSYRGPGLGPGLAMLERVRGEVGCPVLTDVHETHQVDAVARVADVIQIPAFLCRQTDLVTAAAATGRALNLKKGQFLSPGEMGSVTAKALATGNRRLLLTERGTFFGYGRLVVDMSGLPRMRSLGFPVLFDATHSTQRPGGLGDRSGGDPDAAPVLARAAAAAGCDGLFLEVHPDPPRARSDASTSLTFAACEAILAAVAAIYGALGQMGGGKGGAR
jgi:2-dehydro-3-deoxyphosphooctonate aldolase (KDO 8-P synthase)